MPVSIPFAVGYSQIEDGPSFPALAAEYREHLAEVYFPWVGMPSGRPQLGAGLDQDEARERLVDDLRVLKAFGFRLDLLLNGNCHGGRAASQSLAHEVLRVLEDLERGGTPPQVVTTASPAIAQVLKTHAPNLEVRASVNMRLGSTRAMEYLADLFDSFYLQRDIQRDLSQVRRVSAWCREHGKKLGLLANSGCLRSCPSQTFHDNLVAHHLEAEHEEPIPHWNPHLCWRLYGQGGRAVEFLRSTWIRPEDLHHYGGLVDFVKLATRQHASPRLVIDAYASGRFNGNLLELMEPGLAPAFSPQFIDNAAFPSDWFARTSTCSQTCDQCETCGQVLEKVLQRYPSY
jgi:collagenase-like PrtC family protease